MGIEVHAQLKSRKNSFQVDINFQVYTSGASLALCWSHASDKDAQTLNPNRVESPSTDPPAGCQITQRYGES